MGAFFATSARLWLAALLAGALCAAGIHPATAGVTVVQYGFDFTTGTVESQGPVANDAGASFAASASRGNGGTYSPDLPAKRRFTTGIGSLDLASGSISSNPDGATEGFGPVDFEDIVDHGGLTIEVWAKGRGTGNSIILTLSGTHMLYATPTGVKWINEFNQLGIEAETGTGWHHLAGIVSNPVISDEGLRGDMSFYVDGVLRGTVTGTQWFHDLSRGIAVGNHPLKGVNNPFTGRVYEPRLSLGVLTPEEFTIMPAPNFVVELAPGGRLTNGEGRIAFGEVPPGSAVTKTLTIRNVGNADLSDLAATVEGPHAAEYVISRQPDATVPGGGSTTLDVTFTPVATGPRTATLRIASDGADENSFDIELVAPGALMEISSPVGALASGDTVDFGSVPVGTASDLTFTIANPGNDTLTGISAVVAGGGTTGFSVVSPPAATAGPGGGTSFTVRFRPGGTGNFAATLRIACSAANTGPVDLRLTGLGSAASSALATGIWMYGGPLGSPAPAGIAVPYTFTAVAAGYAHTAALTQDGGVIQWGYRGNNVPAAAQSGVIAITSGHFQTLALKEDGGVVAWGDGSYGLNTVPAAARSGVTAIAAGHFQAVALKQDGSVVTWGRDNFYGLTTVPPEAQSGVTAIAAGYMHTVALKEDGSVIAWGNNLYTTVPAEGQSGVTAIAAYGSHTVALKEDGSVVTWGNEALNLPPVPAAAQGGVTAIAAGFYHTVALKQDGSVVAWGNNSWGQATVPAAARSGVIAIAAGENHSVALKQDGSVVAWGHNLSGQSAVPAAALRSIDWLGIFPNPTIAKGVEHTVELWQGRVIVRNNLTQTTVPVPAAAQSGVTAIAAGGYHTLALKQDGSIVAWGNNQYGQTTVPAEARTGVIAIAAGDYHSLALRQDGRVFAWGAVFKTANMPVEMRTGITAIAAGKNHNVALKQDGRVVTWGTTLDNYGQILVPAEAQRAGVTAIAATGNVTFYRIADPSAMGPFTTWAGLHGLSGAAALRSASPFQDGVPNVLKYAFRMNAAGPDGSTLVPSTGTAGLPAITTTLQPGTGPGLRIEYIRRKASTNPGITYTPEFTSDLSGWQAATGTQSVQSIDATWERVVVVDPAGAGQASRFGRIRVSTP